MLDCNLVEGPLITVSSTLRHRQGVQIGGSIEHATAGLEKIKARAAVSVGGTRSMTARCVGGKRRVICTLVIVGLTQGDQKSM